MSSQLKGYSGQLVSGFVGWLLNLEQNPNQLFTVPSPLAGQRRATHVKEGRLESCRDCLSKEICKEKENSLQL